MSDEPRVFLTYEMIADSPKKQLMFNESPTTLGSRDQIYTAITNQDLSLPAPPLETTISTEISAEEEVGVV